jgi:hypothetical protein
MMAYSDLEIGLHRQDAYSYRIELRFSQPGDEADIRVGGDKLLLVQFDTNELRQHELDAEAYGLHLGKSLFGDEDMKNAFTQALSNAQTLEVPLRVRLFVGPSAPELHSLRWETLRDPRDGSSLLTSEHILFSRYLSSYDWRPVHLRPKAGLRTIVVIANPSNLTEKSGGQLAPIDVDSELARVKANLGGIVVEELASDGSATLDNLIDRLREGFDILYLVCHGTLKMREPWLWLEDDSGKTHRVAGTNFVSRLKELQQRPRLVVLASCQSAGSGEDAPSGEAGMLAALGPRLAEAGIPAVLAMQGNVSTDTVSQFMPDFFKELLRDGQIDRAMAVARGEVRGRVDWWMPVLFMRLKSGRIWYVPGFAEERRGLEKWPALLSNIRDKLCTPILGPGVTEHLLGSRREIAQRWAKTYHFPMAPHNCEDLPQVAQFLAVNQQPTFPRRELMEYLRQEMWRRYECNLPEILQGASLDELITTFGRQWCTDNLDEPHRILAELPLPIYITTNPGNLLREALICAGKEPQVELCRWNEDLVQLPSIFDRDRTYIPDERRPLIYHLFGRLEEADSLVLTEDDYFDYLIGVTSNKELIPSVVRRKLSDTALLFLGFQLDDWNFRILFRSIMAQEGGGRRKKYAHVAAQIDPEEGRILSPERAREYLEEYFQDADISIYWGSTADFTQELKRLWNGGNY